MGRATAAASRPMPIRTALWTTGSPPKPLADGQLVSEQQLEQMIVDAPSLLSDDWLLVGRQEKTGTGGRIDLLAVEPDGALVLIELKRDQTPREVVAQALDYAGWVEQLDRAAVEAGYAKFQGGDLAADFARKFGQPLDEVTLNGRHQIVLVATGLDPASERIVRYLSRRNVPINVLCFQVFAHPAGPILARTWLLDPAETQAAVAAAGGPAGPWNGEFYCSFGDGPNRSWVEAVEHGFICAGGGPWYSRTLRLLKPCDRVWVRIPQVGYVGVGRVAGEAVPAADFYVAIRDGGAPFIDVAHAKYHRDFRDDPDRCEYFVPVHWLQTVSRDKAVTEAGLFGNQNTVCRPTTPNWPATVERLTVAFPRYDDPPAGHPPA